jgi:hypothetical protein
VSIVITVIGHWVDLLAAPLCSDPGSILFYPTLSYSLFYFLIRKHHTTTTVYIVLTRITPTSHTTLCMSIHANYGPTNYPHTPKPMYTHPTALPHQLTSPCSAPLHFHDTRHTHDLYSITISGLAGQFTDKCALRSDFPKIPTTGNRLLEGWS